MITIDLSEREWQSIMSALRAQEEIHKRHDFKVLVLEMQAIRSHMADAMIDSKVVVG